MNFKRCATALEDRAIRKPGRALGRLAPAAAGGLLVLFTLALPLASGQSPGDREKQSSSETAGILSAASGLDDYVRHAEENNPRLLALKSKWAAVRETISQAKALPDPMLAYSYFIRKVETRVGPQRESVTVSQSIPWFGKLKLKGEIRAEQANAVLAELEAARLELRYQVEDVYYKMYFLAKSIDITNENLELIKYLESIVRVRYSVAKATYSDVIRAQVMLGKLEDRKGRLEDRRPALEARMNAQLNRPQGAPINWPSRLTVDELDLDEQRLFAKALAANPQLKGLDFQIASLENQLRLAGRNLFPDLNFSVGIIDTAGALNPDLPGSGKNPFRAGVMLNVPIRRGKYRAAQREVSALMESTMNRKADLENQLRAALSDAVYEVNDADRRIGLYRDTLIPKGRQAFEANETAYKAGEQEFLSVIDAARDLLEFELAYENALTDKARATASIGTIVGGSPPVPDESGATQGGDDQ